MMYPHGQLGHFCDSACPQAEGAPVGLFGGSRADGPLLDADSDVDARQQTHSVGDGCQPPHERPVSDCNCWHAASHGLPGHHCCEHCRPYSPQVEDVHPRNEDEAGDCCQEAITLACPICQGSGERPGQPHGDCRHHSHGASNCPDQPEACEVCEGAGMAMLKQVLAHARRVLTGEDGGAPKTWSYVREAKELIALVEEAL